MKMCVLESKPKSVLRTYEYKPIPNHDIIICKQKYRFLRGLIFSNIKVWTNELIQTRIDLLLVVGILVNTAACMLHSYAFDRVASILQSGIYTYIPIRVRKHSA